MLGKSPIKWRECPDMTIAVDWDVEHQFKTLDSQEHQGLMIEYKTMEPQILGFISAVSLSKTP